MTVVLRMLLHLTLLTALAVRERLFPARSAPTTR
jgi:hypothetical protein